MDERGSMLPVLAGLVFVSFTVLGLAVDVALVHGTYLRASALADGAAEAGAAIIDSASIHTGVVQVDPIGARIEVEAVVTDSLSTLRSVAISPSEVCVEVHTDYSTLVLTFVGIPNVDVAVWSCAAPATG